MKSLFIVLSVFAVFGTFSGLRAYGADATDCKNIVQSPTVKSVNCDASKGACPAAPAVKSTGSKAQAS